MGVAYATASEDMDSLTFGTKVLLRGFNSKKEPIIMIELAQVLEGFGMTQEEFVDLCIMCGCDYTMNIPGVGPVNAFKLIDKCHNIENVIEKITNDNEDPKKKKKYNIPEAFRYKEARELFINPNAEKVKATIDPLIKWNKPEEENLKQFLVT